MLIGVVCEVNPTYILLGINLFLRECGPRLRAKGPCMQVTSHRDRDGAHAHFNRAMHRDAEAYGPMPQRLAVRMTSMGEISQA